MIDEDAEMRKIRGRIGLQASALSAEAGIDARE